MAKTEDAVRREKLAFIAEAGAALPTGELVALAEFVGCYARDELRGAVGAVLPVFEARDVARRKAEARA